MKERPNSTKRFTRLKVSYIVVCLCLEFIRDVSTAAAKDQVKDEQSFAQIKSSSNNLSNNSRKQDKIEALDNSLSRKSRSLRNYDLSSVFSEDDIFNENLEAESDSDIYKRSKGSSLIPFSRIGRGSFDPNLIMPYPDEWVVPYLPKAQNNLKANEESLLNLDSKSDDPLIYNDSDNEGSDSDMEEDISSETFESVDPKSIKEREINSNGTIIPYPRFGKRYGISKVILKDAHSIRKKRTSESIIPQIRYGRSSNEPIKFSKFNKLTTQGMLPYPRPGRSENNAEKREGYILPLPRFGRSIDDKSMEITMKLKPLKTYKIPEEIENSEETPFFLIPYPRPGKRFFGTKPLPPNVKLESKDKETVIQESKDKEPTLVTFLVPYPRPGRSNSGSQSIIPSFRFGRSGANSIVPYPRPGRSTNKETRKYMLPYPRLGRSDNKASLIPSARFGKSTSFHSSSLLPYPRVEKSSDSILPYPPRFGRASASIIPQLRVGKSDDSDINLLFDEFKLANENSKVLNGMIIGIDQINDENASNESEKDHSNNIKSALLVPAKKLQKHMLTENSNYMLPYPRPGRTL